MGAELVGKRRKAKHLRHRLTGVAFHAPAGAVPIGEKLSSKSDGAAAGSVSSFSDEAQLGLAFISRVSKLGVGDDVVCGGRSGTLVSTTFGEYAPASDDDDDDATEAPAPAADEAARKAAKLEAMKARLAAAGLASRAPAPEAADEDSETAAAEAAEAARKAAKLAAMRARLAAAGLAPEEPP